MRYPHGGCERTCAAGSAFCCVPASPVHIEVHPDPLSAGQRRSSTAKHWPSLVWRHASVETFPTFCNPPPPRSGHRNCRNVPERFAGTL